MADGWAVTAETVLVAGLTPCADAEKAAEMRRYMRGQFAFLGVRGPERTEAWRAARSAADEAHGRPGGDELLAFARAMWRRPQREYRYLGAKALAARATRLEPRHLDAIRALLVTDPWWDTVDILAPNVVGLLARRWPDEVVPVLDLWVVDEDKWLVRTAVIHQLKAKEDTDVDRLARYCRAAAPHGDFFVRKAVGWALRQYSYVDPDWVQDFVAGATLSGLSEREALKAIRRGAHGR